MEPKEEILRLTNILNEANYRYYVLDDPDMPDFEYDRLLRRLEDNPYSLIVVNFANGDMVGHTGVYDAIEAAVKAVDKCVGEVIEAAKATGYEAIIIADHGNADNAVNPDGSPNTAHSLNPVPCIAISDKVKSLNNGILADVAPTILKLMGIEQPKEMTGKALY